MMKTLALTLAAITCTATLATAQTEGKVSVGASVTLVRPSDADVQSTIGFGPVVRLNPKPGWGVAAALNWFEAELRNPGGGDSDFATLRIRPLMAGVGYTVERGMLMTTVSVVAGPSFNRAKIEDEFFETLPAGARAPEIQADRSFAFRPGVGLTYTLAPRVALTGFAGYMINRPKITYRDPTGQEVNDRWKADASVLSVGLVYSLF